jgi:hypothetical protein
MRSRDLNQFMRSCDLNPSLRYQPFDPDRANHDVASIPRQLGADTWGHLASSPNFGLLDRLRRRARTLPLLPRPHPTVWHRPQAAPSRFEASERSRNTSRRLQIPRRGGGWRGPHHRWSPRWRAKTGVQGFQLRLRVVRS